MPIVLAGQPLGKAATQASSCQGSTPPLAQPQASWAASDLPAHTRVDVCSRDDELFYNSAAKSRWEKNIVGLESKTDGLWIMTISEVTVVLG